MFRIPIADGATITALVVLAIFLTMMLIAFGLPPKSQLLPLMVSIPGSVLAIIQVVLELRRAAHDESKVDKGVRQVSKAELHMLAWVLTFFAGILCFGFVYAVPVLVFSFLFLGKKESFKVSLVSGTGIWAVIYGFFQHWLEIPLFEGLILEWLIR